MLEMPLDLQNSMKESLLQTGVPVMPEEEEGWKKDLKTRCAELGKDIIALNVLVRQKEVLHYAILILERIDKQATNSVFIKEKGSYYRSLDLNMINHLPRLNLAIRNIVKRDPELVVTPNRSHLERHLFNWIYDEQYPYFSFITSEDNVLKEVNIPIYIAEYLQEIAETALYGYLKKLLDGVVKVNAHLTDLDAANVLNLSLNGPQYYLLIVRKVDALKMSSLCIETENYVYNVLACKIMYSFPDFASFMRRIYDSEEPFKIDDTTREELKSRLFTSKACEKSNNGSLDEKSAIPSKIEEVKMPNLVVEFLEFISDKILNDYLEEEDFKRKQSLLTGDIGKGEGLDEKSVPQYLDEVEPGPSQDSVQKAKEKAPRLMVLHFVYKALVKTEIRTVIMEKIPDKSDEIGVFYITSTDTYYKYVGMERIADMPIFESTLLNYIKKNRIRAVAPTSSNLGSRLFIVNFLADDDTNLQLFCEETKTFRPIFEYSLPEKFTEILARSAASFEDYSARKAKELKKIKEDMNQVIQETNKLRSQIGSVEKKLLCKVCTKNEINTVFSCGHTSCRSCAKILEKVCNVCKKKMTFSPLHL